MHRIILATGNLNKVREISASLEGSSIEIMPQSMFNVPDADETGTTFVENAIIKARNCAAHTGEAAMADDSGIGVDALGGAPGVHSARYSGEHANDEKNTALLLRNMEDVPDGKRTARYWCVMVYMRSASDPTPIICQASWEGIIIREKRGTNGFGYDPVFLIPELGKTAAEVSLEVKNSMSHRAKAIKMMTERLREMHA
ncbi:MAG: RdgB/HAM1 family non-canonical purine NTP pyrophosphatase [Pseudomonadota bacterium]|jgi:XTP/dITP diphosphohydrolase|nr:RdgB/HAM1 family non-canonical purine NTP pyrophosphatase [Pseudomonadota bacterium]MDY6374741.1 RdgB/HAM1 family non-canonical purine NTP pyrophosphatase [Succinivibrionaceae bacterium]